MGATVAVGDADMGDNVVRQSSHLTVLPMSQDNFDESDLTGFPMSPQENFDDEVAQATEGALVQKLMDEARATTEKAQELARTQTATLIQSATFGVTCVHQNQTPKNTLLAYENKIIEFTDFCKYYFPGEPHESQKVTEEKMFLWLVFVAVRPARERGGNKAAKFSIAEFVEIMAPFFKSNDGGLEAAFVLEEGLVSGGVVNTHYCAVQFLRAQQETIDPTTVVASLGKAYLYTFTYTYTYIRTHVHICIRTHIHMRICI